MVGVVTLDVVLSIEKRDGYIYLRADILGFVEG